MKLIINIDEEDYKECIFRKDLLSLGGEPTDLTFNMRMETIIANGTPLQEEFEEIKAELQNLSTNNFLEMIPKGEAVQIVDNHIKELNNEIL